MTQTIIYTVNLPTSLLSIIPMSERAEEIDGVIVPNGTICYGFKELYHLATFTREVLQEAYWVHRGVSRHTAQQKRQLLKLLHVHGLALLAWSHVFPDRAGVLGSLFDDVRTSLSFIAMVRDAAPHWCERCDAGNKATVAVVQGDCKTCESNITLTQHDVHLCLSCFDDACRSTIAFNTMTHEDYIEREGFEYWWYFRTLDGTALGVAVVDTEKATTAMWK